MSLPIVRGHDAVWGRLCDALTRNRLPHALLFTGPPGIGKSMTARRLAMRIACTSTHGIPCGECPGCQRVIAGSHPDLAMLGVPRGKKEIGIEQARHLKRFVHLHAVTARRKMAIIDDADRLSLSAQNALLKTLEEPPGNALLVLISSSPGALLPTIRSRCQVIVFQPLTADNVRDVLSGLGLDADEAAALSSYADHSPGRALIVRDRWRGQERQELRNLLADLDASRYVSVVAISKVLGRTEQEMTTKLEELLAWYHEVAVQGTLSSNTDSVPTDSAARHMDRETAVRRADAVADALRVLRRFNPNRPLLAEALALRLARC